MKKLGLILAFLIGSVASAFAACTGPVVMHDFPGTSFNMSVVQAATGANDCQSNVAVPTWAGGTLGAMANYGTSPGAVLVPGVNAFVTNTPPVSQSGTWTVQPGNTANTTPWLASISQGGNTAIVKAGNTFAGTEQALGVAVTNTLTALTPGDGITTGTYASGSPILGGLLLWNGTTYDRWKSSGSTGIAAAGIFQGSTALSATNGLFTNVLQGNAVLSTTNPLPVAAAAATTGGSTPYTPFVPAASDNHQTVKNGAGTSFSVTTSNNSATKNYLRLYDAGTGFNGCNSATGVIFAMEIPPTDSGFTVLTGGTNGLAFSTGLSVCVTSGFGLTDTTNATATAMYVNIAYK